MGSHTCTRSVGSGSTRLVAVGSSGTRFARTGPGIAARSGSSRLVAVGSSGTRFAWSGPGTAARWGSCSGAGQVGTAAPVFDSASGVPVSDSARPVTLSCNTWVYPLVEGKDAKPLPLRVSSPVRIVVHAPLASWGWAAKSDRLYTGNQTAIPEVRGQAPRHYYYDGIPAAVPVLHRGSRGGSGTGDNDSGSGEGAIADTAEAQAAAQTVPAAEPMSRPLPPPLFPLSR